MPEYLAPGVYVEELPSGVRPLSAAPTDVPAFIGRTATGPTDDHDGGPITVTNWAHYQQRFGGFADSARLAHAVYGFFQNGGSRCQVVRLPDAWRAPDVLDLIGDPAAIPLDDDVTMVALPDLFTVPHLPEGNDDRACIEVQRAVLERCEREHRMAILDTPPALGPQDARRWRDRAGFDSAFGALYFPWLRIADPTSTGGATSVVPPCGHVAGIWSRNDRVRGVWKAPANEVVVGALDLEHQITTREHDLLNPVGINAIREFSGRGIRVWGARTLAASDATWRYVNVRRLFTMIETTIADGTTWTVFEPNDEPLWQRVRLVVGQFLDALWRDGALAGSAPDEAYFVKCGTDTTTTASIAAGRLELELGIAPIKPAEFVVIRVQLRARPSDG